ncbi:prolyl 4-hydroxylase subunit alpha-2-like [Scaptodrosophila lebanonensis]|uniref:procollagen-proline 4-dioxygenase n=1 Tax=Drosophila lebanonensis TaxID=7225 RepID=A0A6J2T251_DROLE|nr:prolyl 4-hydroxylase subunit alpha-2-like [Scaptodrosophila lebanonensis]
MRTFLIFCIFLGSACADYYTATSDLEVLFAAENILVEKFDDYLNKVEQKQTEIKEFLNYVDALQAEMSDPEAYHGNPLNAIVTIRRFVYQWKHDVLEKIFSTQDYDDYKITIANELQQLNITMPTQDDILGAGSGLLRLQETYKLSTSELADGKILDRQTEAELSASDCYEMGRNAHELNQHQYAVEWLLQARSLNQHPENITQVSDLQILELLAPALNRTGNLKLAHMLNSEILKQQPAHEAAIRDNIYYLHEMLRQRHILTAPQEDQGEDGKRSEEKPSKPDKYELYRRTCRGELRPTARQQRNLRCRYTDNNVPFRRLAPFKMELLSEDPFVAYYHNAMHESEMEQLQDVGFGNLKRTRVGQNSTAATSSIRNSKGIWLWYEKNSWLASIYQRLEDITGLSMESGEALQLANYGIGGQYEPHYDYMSSPTNDWKGNRILTALFYINDVDMGGGTAFPYLPLLVNPVKGSVVVWYNMHSSTEKDFRVLHAGCPVLKGSKWICNEWMHEGGQEFRRPCGLAPERTKSAAYEA